MDRTFVEAENGKRDLLSPRTLFLQSDAIARTTEQLSRGRQVAVRSSLILETGRVPDERLKLLTGDATYQLRGHKVSCRINMLQYTL